jgi:hypothetical protein
MQMLYLPGLKNVVANFLSRPPPLPHRSHLELSLPRRRQIQLTSKPWPLSKIAAQKRSVCLAVHPSKLHFGKQALNVWLETSPQAFFAQLSLKSSEKMFFKLAFTPWEARLSAYDFF